MLIGRERVITTYGIKQGQHTGIVRSTLTMDALFKPALD